MNDQLIYIVATAMRTSITTELAQMNNHVVSGETLDIEPKCAKKKLNPKQRRRSSCILIPLCG